LFIVAVSAAVVCEYWSRNVTTIMLKEKRRSEREKEKAGVRKQNKRSKRLPAPARRLCHCQIWKRAMKKSWDQFSVISLKSILASLFCDDLLTIMDRKQVED
jgi:hypothetical protein